MGATRTALDRLALERQLLTAMLARGAEDYKEATRILATLDDKSQKTGTIAGALLAAGLGLVKTNVSATLGPLGMALLLVTIVFLIACVATCLSVMWVRRIPEQVTLKKMIEWSNDLLDLSDAELTEERCTNHLWDQINTWKKQCEAMAEVNRQKGVRLLAGQLLLGTSLFVIGGILLLVVSHLLVLR